MRVRAPSTSASASGQQALAEGNAGFRIQILPAVDHIVDQLQVLETHRCDGRAHQTPDVFALHLVFVDQQRASGHIADSYGLIGQHGGC